LLKVALNTITLTLNIQIVISQGEKKNQTLETFEILANTAVRFQRYKICCDNEEVFHRKTVINDSFTGSIVESAHCFK